MANRNTTCYAFWMWRWPRRRQLSLYFICTCKNRKHSQNPESVILRHFLPLTVTQLLWILTVGIGEASKCDTTNSQRKRERWRIKKTMNWKRNWHPTNCIVFLNEWATSHTHNSHISIKYITSDDYWAKIMIVNYSASVNNHAHIGRKNGVDGHFHAFTELLLWL